MKKHFTHFIIVALVLVSQVGISQKKAQFTLLEGQGIIGGVISSISSNGRYATGTTSSDNSFLVDIVAGTTTIIEGPEVLRDGKVSKRFAAYDVSNDGTIVGTYYDPNTTHIGSNGAESSREMPCMYKDGVFTTLAKLEDSEYFNYETSNASGISGDGNTIVGITESSQPYAAGTSTAVAWRDNGASITALEQVPTPNATSAGQGANAWSVSDDGRVAAGWALYEAFVSSEYGDYYTNEKSPVVWHDGVITRLGTSHVSSVFVSANGKYVGASDLGVDADGREVAGIPFIWSLEEGKKFYPINEGFKSANVLGITDDGSRAMIVATRQSYSSTVVLDNGELSTLENFLKINYDYEIPDGASYIAARGMSADGNTIVGQCLMPAGYGGAVREVLTGFILELSDLTSIKKVALTQTEVSVAVNNSILSIASLNGTERIESMRVYAAGGNQIISQENINSTNLDVNMSAYAAGIYVVRVVTDKGTLAKKIVLKK
ncbi:hypothetical protein AwDysgo_03050 [Bacteroidales bacterium]|nr:hypothetical protein AwDysgo_03050 [Bacteroidales bacterium]